MPLPKELPHVGSVVRIKGDESRDHYAGHITDIQDGYAHIRWSDGLRDDQGNWWGLGDLVEVD